MSKPTQGKQAPEAAPEGDIHARIAAEAKALRDAVGELRFECAVITPALRALLDSATAHLAANIPPSFMHEGRTYYLRQSIGVTRAMIFETASAPEPMVSALLSGREEFGHTPFH